MDNNNNNNQIQNANQNENQNENEMKNLEKKVTKNLIKDYSNLLNGNSFNDFSIFIENKSNPFEIKVHKSILSSRSPFFNESLRQESLSISLNQFNKKEMESILNSISKQDFDKLKQFDFFPNSFLVDIQNKVIQDNQKEIEEKEKEIEEKWKKEVENKEKENQQMKIEIEDKWKKEIENKEKENQQMKIEIEEKLKKEKKEIEEKWKKEVENKNKEIEEKWKKENEDLKEENEKMKPVFDEYEKEFEEIQKKMEPIKKNFPQFSETRIITEEEYVKKLQEWINDNDFFSKMKKGFSAKRDGFNSQNWHKAVDGKGKTLVIIKTKQNFIFGGFTQVGFNGDTGYINDSNAFIFSLRNDKGDRIPAKFTCKEPQYYAINSYLNHGPDFGYYDFRLDSNLQPGYSNFGRSYNLPNGIKEGTDEAKSYLAGSHNSWVVDEVESYFI
ncbi:hypothetical protein M0811_07333 [Anaeramoeba ignava]|uniref:TLDc domain-containing protein n=1 Tax=Anaeramoeba ignava TaxID=1746090 RepID=A0A9Q0LM61_ANAIG|nr:hypothetical protein M0811_07333 [Anaeramoeba ignava]